MVDNLTRKIAGVDWFVLYLLVKSYWPECNTDADAFLMHSANGCQLEISISQYYSHRFGIDLTHDMILLLDISQVEVVVIVTNGQKTYVIV